MNPCLTQNLGALVRHPHVMAVLERVGQGSGAQFANAAGVSESGADRFQIETAKNGEKTLVVHAASGKSYSYHSKYDPSGESRKQVATSFQKQSHVLVLGFGLGYALEELLRQLPPGNGERRVMLVEPDPLAFSTALSCRDLRSLLSDNRVEWCVGLNPDQIGDRWNQYLDWTAMESLAILEHPPTLSRFPGFFERVKEKVRYLCTRSKGNLVTLMYSGTDFHTNNFLNVAPTMRNPGVARLFGRFPGVPAVVVAAGPSLEKNVHLLREVRDRFLVIATDTALRQLVARDLRPDIVCAADPCYENSLDFVGMEEEREVVLAFEPMTHPDIITSFQGPKLGMTFGGGLIPALQPFREDIGKVVCWGSIATTCFDLARQCGCNPIIFLGLDLSFADGKLYAAGSYSDDLMYDRVHSFSSLEHEITDYIATRGAFELRSPEGKLFYTDYNMNLYRSWFEDQFRQIGDRLIVNCTEGGVVAQYVRCIPFAQAIARWGGEDRQLRKRLADLMAEPVQCDEQGLQSFFRQLRRELSEHLDLAKRGLGAIRKLERLDGSAPLKGLAGEFKMRVLEVLDWHDRLCDHQTLFSWISIHQARFITRHTMEIRQLKADVQAPVRLWIEAIRNFFEAMIRFHEYQMPLLDQASSTLFGKGG